MEYLKLSLLWVLWCFFHSFLISPSVTIYFQKLFKNKFRFYRVFYNLFSVLSLIFIYLYKTSFTEEILWSWDGTFLYIQIILFLLSVFLMIAGAKLFDIKLFFGIRQILIKNSSLSLNVTGKLEIKGILKYTRHPWYLATFLLIWVSFQDLALSRVIINMILTIYLIIGTILEERKLVLEFGDDYTGYQKRVSMFVPFRFYR